MKSFSIAVIGVGRLGGALAIALSKSGYEVSQIVTRNYEKAKHVADLIKPRPQIINSEEFEKISADVIFIATQDNEIPTIVESLAERLEHLPYVFHTSGALSSKILQALSDEGCEIGSLHPLVSISEAKSGANHFKDAYFCVEGDPEAVTLAKEIVEELKGKTFSIAAKHKALYHASAVTACGHLTALVSAAIEMLSKCGLSSDEAQKILLPLIASTIQNLFIQTPAEALTGTFARADIKTLQNHLQILQENSSAELLKIYQTLGLRSLPLARAQGADEAKLEQMQQILKSLD